MVRSTGNLTTYQAETTVRSAYLITVITPSIKILGAGITGCITGNGAS